MEVITMLLGLIVLYTTIHLFALQLKAYENRTTYEKVVTWVSIVSIILVFMGLMMD